MHFMADRRYVSILSVGLEAKERELSQTAVTLRIDQRQRNEYFDGARSPTVLRGRL